MKWSRKLAGTALVLALVSVTGLYAVAAGFFTNGVPPAGGTQYPSTLPLTGIETIPADTNLLQGLNPASEAITTKQLATYAGGQISGGNILIGGDATTNLFQRATTGSSVTTTFTYGGPDRWGYWSGTSTAMTVSRDSTAADLPTGAGYLYGFKMARTSGQTGVVQVCMLQEVESVNSYQMAGHTVELDFYARAGANFSAASSAMTAYVIYGTGSDEGAAKAAFGLNAGGGGGSGWTGQTNATAASIIITTTPTKYGAVASVPATATEVALALCWTPVGTAGTNDYIALAGIQLRVNDGLSAQANATKGYDCVGNSTNSQSINCSKFNHRLQGQENVLQYRYYYKIAEGATVAARGLCRSRSVTACSWDIKFPVVMRTAPTMSYTAGFAAETTTAGGTLGACSALAADTTVASTVASAERAYALCTATTIPAAGTADQIYDNSGSGVVQANAEL